MRVTTRRPRAARYALRLHAEELAIEHLFASLLEDEECGATRLVLHAFADPETLAVEVLALCPGIMVVGSEHCLPFSVRGVRTQLVVPKRNDSRLVAAASRSLYEPLLAAGVEIYEYTEGLLHAKTVTIDRDGAIVSTANLDRRSFELNFEVSLVVYDTDFASELRFLQRSYLSDAVSIDSARWRRRSAAVRLWHNTAGMLSPLL